MMPSTGAMAPFDERARQGCFTGALLKQIKAASDPWHAVWRNTLLAKDGNVSGYKQRKRMGSKKRSNA